MNVGLIFLIRSKKDPGLGIATMPANSVVNLAVASGANGANVSGVIKSPIRNFDRVMRLQVGASLPSIQLDRYIA